MKTGTRCWTDGIMQIGNGKGHFYSPFLPKSDNKGNGCLTSDNVW